MASVSTSTSTSLLPTLAAFGIVSALVTTLERRRQKRQQQQCKQPPTHHPPPVPRPHPSPARLVRYLKEHGGKKWKHYDADMEVFVRECPKVELHVHLDGSLDPDFLWHCMKQCEDGGDAWITCLPVNATLPWDAQHPLPVRHLVQSCKTVDDFHALCTCRRGQRSLQHMLTCFEIFLPLVRGAPPAVRLLEELAYDFCRRQWEQHVVYTEVRYCPHLLTNNQKEISGSFAIDLDPDDDDNLLVEDGGVDEKQLARKESARQVVHAITRGLQRGCKDYNIVVNQILCAINWRPDWANDVLDLALEFRNDGQQCSVVGIDIAAGEEHFDQHNFPQLYQAHFDMMQKAQKLDLPIAIHAGETPNGIHHVRKAMATHKDNDPGYGAKRIGHGYRMADSTELMQQIAEKQIHVEICPTSSVETGGWIFDEAFMEDDESSVHTASSHHTQQSLAQRRHSSQLSLEKQLRRDSLQSHLQLHPLLLRTTTTHKQKKPWKDHPGLKMMKHGIPISLNSDDPAVFHTSLTWQYRIALIKMGLSKEEVMMTNIHAIQASFGRPNEKNHVESLLQQFICTLRNGNKVESVIQDRFTDRVRDPF